MANVHFEFSRLASIHDIIQMLTLSETNQGDFISSTHVWKEIKEEIIYLKLILEHSCSPQIFVVIVVLTYEGLVPNSRQNRQ